jgi:hypothetical protein
LKQNTPSNSPDSLSAIKTIFHSKHLFKAKETDYEVYLESLQVYFPEWEIDNITRDPNQLLFLVNNIPTIGSAD